MAKMILKISGVLAGIGLISSCNFLESVESRAHQINQYERVSLVLAKENRELQAEIGRLQFELQKLESRQAYLETKLNRSRPSVERGIASVAGRSAVPKMPSENLVQWDTYKWGPDQLLAAAHKSFSQQDFKKAAEFFHALSVYYPGHEVIDDRYHYQAGVAAFESGHYPEWTLYHMNKLLDNYPTSTFYRGAKLWNALTHLQKGRRDVFFETVEEFRMKYRNTPEWRILSTHYQEILNEFSTH